MIDFVNHYEESNMVKNDLMRNRAARINALSKINQSNSYLEIGVNKGITFSQVEIKHKVAVDPTFKFNYVDYESDNTKFYEMTSDRFYQLDTETIFDLIYLDGLHIFEQTFRDFCATLTMARESTIWLIDDTAPIDVFAAERSMQRCYALRRASGGKGGAWMGDVFKVIYAIHDFFPQFNYATFTGHGQTVVWREMRTDFEPQWNSLAAISELTYVDFLDTKDKIMNFARPNQIVSHLKNVFK